MGIKNDRAQKYGELSSQHTHMWFPTVHELDIHDAKPGVMCKHPSVFTKVNMKSKLSLFSRLSINHISIKSTKK